MHKYVTLTVLLLGFHCKYAWADEYFSEQNYQALLEKECGQLQQNAERGQQYLQQAQYPQALKQFQHQAAWTSICGVQAELIGFKVSEQQQINAEHDVGLSYIKLGKPLHARAWFLIHPEYPPNHEALSALVNTKTTQHLQGTYLYYLGYGRWNRITVTRNKNHYDIAFEGFYFHAYTAALGAPNMGEFYTRMPSTDTSTTYQDTHCRIDIAFKTDTLKGRLIDIEQKGYDSDCGFGANVNATGQYIQVEDEND